MSARKGLRAVAPDEKAKPKAATTILEAAEAGSRLEELRAIRRRLAVALDNPNTLARDLASLSRRQLEIGREIDAVVVAEDEDHSVVVTVDDAVWDGSGY